MVLKKLIENLRNMKTKIVYVPVNPTAPEEDEEYIKIERIGMNKAE